MTPLSLFVSRLVLPASSQHSSANRDLHGIHDTLWAGFRQLPKDAPRPFLFRADRHALESGARVWKVLVQSTIEAAWGSVGAIEAEQKHVNIAFVAGESLRFFLRANPVASVKGKDQRRFAELDTAAFRAARGLKVPIRGEDDLRAWLERQGAQHGFTVDALRLVREHRETWRARSSSGSDAVHEGCDFEGHLRVTTPDALGQTLVTGLGRGRGFGFGLLSLARERG
jgi:CRISPR system Cascade subunit CasE